MRRKYSYFRKSDRKQKLRCYRLILSQETTPEKKDVSDVSERFRSVHTQTSPLTEPRSLTSIANPNSSCNSVSPDTTENKVQLVSVSTQTVSSRDESVFKKPELPPPTSVTFSASVSSTRQLPRTPVPLQKLSFTSPCATVASLEMLSTPSLFPKVDGPDLLSMIDDDLLSPEGLDSELCMFDDQSLCDENIADYIMSISDGHNDKRNDEMKQTNLLQAASDDLPMSKQTGHEYKDVSSVEQCVSKKRGRRRRGKDFAYPPKRRKKEPELYTDVLKRKVRQCRRKTRSLIRAYKELGLASNDSEAEALIKGNEDCEE